ncbi:50S ribosomal protein L1 [Herpetosiphon gulosus]|uniref:Large ribosomal subunit protein uL1 n=1 Tax=Herpetosiphon gulosus TaxID=1973496 RepID=A0ABP9X6A1_9CHLR
MAKQHGKKYLAAAAKVEADRLYTPEEAAALVKETSFTNFDATVELHVRLGIDPRHADQTVRSTASLPHGTGKNVRVLVFAQGDTENIARNAGAEIVGGDELIQRIEKENFIDFDVAVATPDMMGKVGRLGRILGRRGLMPNPKSGTVVPPGDLPQAIKALQGGRVEFRNDKTGLLHVAIGKISFTPDQIRENLVVLLDAIKAAKPSGSKGVYIKSLTLTSTMGPGIPLDVNVAQATA